jgi:DNA-binding NarL/FixJ family response regulator
MHILIADDEPTSALLVALYRAKAGGRNQVAVAGDESAVNEPPIRVLVADDDPLMRGLMALIAEHEPSIDLVGAASDADPAIDLAAIRRARVVVLDLDMPGGGGTRAALEIRRLVPDARIVGLSGDDSRQAQPDIARAGAVGYLVKGAQPDEIVRTIHSSARF